jgi:hypothetical protein
VERISSIVGNSSFQSTSCQCRYLICIVHEDSKKPCIYNVDDLEFVVFARSTSRFEVLNQASCDS